MTEPSLDLVPNLIRSRRRSQLRLLQNDSDLFDRIPLPLHDKPSFLLDLVANLTSQMDRFMPGPSRIACAWGLRGLVGGAQQALSSPDMIVSA